MRARSMASCVCALDGLRVVDASVMPTLVGRKHETRRRIMVAEKARHDAGKPPWRVRKASSASLRSGSSW